MTLRQKPNPTTGMRFSHSVLFEREGRWHMTSYFHDRHGRTWTTRIPVEVPELLPGQQVFDDEWEDGE